MREEGQGDRSRANYQIRSRSFGLSPRYRSALQSSRFVGGYDLNVEFGDMKMWDDPRIIEAASVGAIELYAHAVNGIRLEPKTGKRMFDVISHILAWCYVHAIEASVKKENESEVQ